MMNKKEKYLDILGLRLKNKETLERNLQEMWKKCMRTITEVEVSEGNLTTRYCTHPKVEAALANCISKRFLHDYDSPFLQIINIYQVGILTELEEAEKIL